MKMSRRVQCDNCGATDDWAGKDGLPFFPHGLVLQFRRDNGYEDFEAELELCAECREKLLAKFPRLKKALEQP
jgi:hypothetical protein